MRLDELPLHQPAYVDSVDWSAMSVLEAQRLRELGLCEGMSVESLHRGGLFGRGPLACQIGRMTVAMRREQAAAITVRTGSEPLAAEERAA